MFELPTCTRALVLSVHAQPSKHPRTCVSLEILWLGDFWLTEKEELGIATYTRVLQTLPTRLGFRNISTYGNHSVPRRHLQDTPTLILADHFQSIFTLSLPNALLPKSTALRPIKWKEDTSVFRGLGSANYCNSSMEPSVTEHILRAAWGQGIPPHSSYRKLRAPFPLNAPPAVCKSNTLCLSAFFLTGIEMVSLPWGETARSRYKGRVAKWKLRSSSKQAGWLSNGSRHIGRWGNKRSSLGKSYASRINRNAGDLSVRDRKPATSAADVTRVSAAEALSENGRGSLQGEIEPRWHKSFCLSRFSKVLGWDCRAQGQGGNCNGHWCGACSCGLEKGHGPSVLDGRSRQMDGRRLTLRKQNSYLSNMNSEFW